MNAHWQQVLKSKWGLSTTLQKLDGERDLNFKVESIEGDHYTLKVMHPECDSGLVDMQCKALSYIQERQPGIHTPAVIKSLDGNLFETIQDDAGKNRVVWVLEYLSGILYADFSPKSISLTHNLGTKAATLNLALAQFDHPSLHRKCRWNLTQSKWITGHLDVINHPERKTIIQSIIDEFTCISNTLLQLPLIAIHNDLNDHNLLIDPSTTGRAELSGVIDFGDMCVAPAICELAIAGAYVVLAHPDPENALASLVAGYHTVVPVSETEIDLLIPLLRMRLAVSVVSSSLLMRDRPNDPYVVVSQAPAWRYLENTAINSNLLTCRLRACCGLPVTTSATDVRNFLDSNRGQFSSIIKQRLATAKMIPLSAENSSIPTNPFNLSASEATGLDKTKVGIQLGYYNEPRLLYTDTAFYQGPWKASDRRSVHLGVDVFAPAGTLIHTPLEASVHSIDNRNGNLDYGGMVVLRHNPSEGCEFYTLYGHLQPDVCDALRIGQKLTAGEAFCKLGDTTVNGGWSAHLHFQLALTLDGIESDWPGVGNPDELYFLHAVFPNPAALLNLPDKKIAFDPINNDAVLADRQKFFASNLKLSYRDPVLFVRGWKQHLFDQWGRAYLDAYNNVPHVGHAHPRIQALVSEQLRRLNTNTRYLHPAQTAFADSIVAKMPAALKVCFFVNSGTEANELALRLARAHTGGKDIITPDHGYHGNTTGAIAISAYKFNAPGGDGQLDWVHLVDLPDDYRGQFKRDDADRAKKYANQIDECLSTISDRASRLAGFIAETFPSVGGQIIPPPGYLKSVYQKVRAAGGICIADEVQTGLGRLGDFYFGFEQQGVIPDIVVLGKPIGNGHPLGVVVTSQAIARSFSTGPEFFSTFGGSTLSCMIGKEVLDIVEQEQLQQNACAMGDLLLQGLRELQQQHSCIGDVRGSGLFIGVELVANSTLRPAANLANYVVNRMREHRILIGIEGVYENVLKIRPPLTIESDDVEMIITTLGEILGESAARL